MDHARGNEKAEAQNPIWWMQRFAARFTAMCNISLSLSLLASSLNLLNERSSKTNAGDSGGDKRIG